MGTCRLHDLDPLDARPEGNSWNHNDRRARRLYQRCARTGGAAALLLVLTLFVIVPVWLFTSQESSARSGVVVAGAVLLALVVLLLATDVPVIRDTVKRRPITAVHAVSQLWARHVDTPSVLDPQDVFPEHVEYEAAWPQIRAEVDVVLASKERIPLSRDTFGGENATIGQDVKGGDGWRVFTVKVGDEVNPDAEKVVPTLVSLLRKHGDKVVACAVSILPPGTRIPPHVGYYKGVLRYMLGVKVPARKDDVYLCINGHKLTWDEGKSVMFDDTYPHCVFNETEETRVVLYMDVLRDLHSGWRNWLNRAVVRAMSGSQVVKDEVKRTEIVEQVE